MPTILGRRVLIGVSAAVMVSLAVPVSAQLTSLGALRGKVVDESGKPVPDAELSFDVSGQYEMNRKGKANSRGEFLQGGLPAVGQWVITARKGDLTGRIGGLEITARGVVDTPDIVMRKGAPPASADARGSAAEAKAKAELEALLKAAADAFAANNYDEAIAKLTEIAGKAPCSECYVTIGDAYVKKNELDKAEQSYLKAAEINPQSPSPHDALVNFYNEQRKFDEASKAAARAVELRGGATAGGGSASASFNAGVIAWNQQKVAEARAHFEKAISLDPKMAEAYYQLAMAYLNENKMAEAKKALETYVQLAPSTPNAEIAKSILGTMK